MNGRRTTSLAILAAIMIAQSAHSGGPEYEVTAIIAGFVCGDHLAAVSPFALNEAGDVVGFVTCSLVQRAFRWTAETGLEVIPMPAGTTESQALAINGSKVVGTYSNPELELGVTGFLYDFQTDQFTSLGTLPGGNWSEAHGINSLGQITGFWGNNLIGPWQAFIWENGKMIDIGPSIGGLNNRALGINDIGAITGWWREDGGERLAFVWEDGEVNSLGPIPKGFSSTGQAINDLGNVAGDGKIVLDDGETIVVQSFLWAENQMTNLGTLPDTTFTRARSINNQTRIVGYCHNQFLTDQAAFIWQDGVIAALNNLIPFDPNLNLERAMGINNAGQIAVAARSDDLNASVGVLLSLIEKGIPGDLDNDGQVGVKDLLILLGDWGSCDNCSNCPADLDNNCVVGVPDLLILLGNWG